MEMLNKRVKYSYLGEPIDTGKVISIPYANVLHIESEELVCIFRPRLRVVIVLEESVLAVEIDGKFTSLKG